MNLSPARLEPIFSPRPWGALSLAPLFPEKSNLSEPIGEAWITGLECRFANGPFAGRYAIIYLGMAGILVAAAFFRRAHQLSGT